MLSSAAVVMLDGLTPFEFGVICEVFGVDRTDDGVPLIDFRACGEHAGKPVRTDIAGVQVTPTHGLEGLVDADAIVVSACAVRDEYPAAVLDALRAASARGATLLSVCNGAFVLGAAGLLDGALPAGPARSRCPVRRRGQDRHKRGQRRGNRRLPTPGPA